MYAKIRETASRNLKQGVTAMKRTKGNKSVHKFAGIALALIASASFSSVLTGCGSNFSTSIETNGGNNLLPDLIFNANEVYAGISKQDAAQKALDSNQGFRIVSDGGRYTYLGKSCWEFELQNEDDTSERRKCYISSEMSASVDS